MQPTPPEVLWQMMELSAQNAPISPAVRHDLDYAIKLLTAAKPDCSDLLCGTTSSAWTTPRLRGTKRELR